MTKSARQTRPSRRTARTATGGTRPKYRKEQIAAVAAEAFSQRGYHSVTIDDIASAVGISGPAVYRHFPNKYALFQHVATGLTTLLTDALDSVDSSIGLGDESGVLLDADARLDAQLRAIIGTTVDHRRRAGLYRWEGRYLAREHRTEVRDRTWIANQRVGEVLSLVRPELTEGDRILVTVAMFSAVGSITAHNVPLAKPRLEQLLLRGCRDMSRIDWADSDLTVNAHGTDGARGAHGLASVNKRENLIQAAVTLFDDRGYHEVTIEEIAAAVGLPASGVYRHFTGKSDILVAALHRAADRVALGVSTALSGSENAHDALDALTAVYVRLSFAQRELMSVYYAEIGSLPGPRRDEIRHIQRLNVEEWALIVAEVRPELTVVECRILVHAALNLVPDVGRFLHFDSEPRTPARIQQLMLALLRGS
ncbi:TetR/AcrR family transcriptional regulator [Rhodococcus sp. HNM0569]|uniref:TetR family transcriptional regulator n=1 Tax=Rhodococcus sp. HNM0569 TaxID=2716340 RepID=UPI001469F0E2|nr:TetR/AcrR family transcriptional regulator [Rhodococcus sp. HNM0569]